MDRSPVFYVDFEDGNTTDIVGGQTAATGDAAIVSNGNGGYAAQFARQAGRSLYYGVSENVNDVLNNANS
ncbi:MAG: hypothetical protein LBO09_05585 [Candidatus Peribacteria bacterium]|jgi:hypothetical protein|nr:hypothetical protein [Candidatus Peribacteria bacterium]